MTALTIAQNVVNEIGYPALTTLVDNTTETAIKLEALINRVGKYARDQYPWPCLIREATVTLATSTASYALPSDFNYQLWETAWNNDEHSQLLGPVDGQDWQYLKRAIGSTTSVDQTYRIKGITSTQFFVDPTPASGDNGHVVYFEYFTQSWLSPRAWVTSTDFTAGRWCSYNGNFYSTVSGGTTGATAPTHTSGSASDGGVTWVYQSAAYDYVHKDNDFSLINEMVLESGVKAFFKREKRLDGYQEDMLEFEKLLRLEFAKLWGGKGLDLGRSRFGEWPNIAKTGYENYGA